MRLARLAHVGLSCFRARVKRPARQPLPWRPAPRAGGNWQDLTLLPAVTRALVVAGNPCGATRGPDRTAPTQVVSRLLGQVRRPQSSAGDGLPRRRRDDVGVGNGDGPVCVACQSADRGSRTGRGNWQELTHNLTPQPSIAGPSPRESGGWASPITRHLIALVKSYN